MPGKGLRSGCRHDPTPQFLESGCERWPVGPGEAGPFGARMNGGGIWAACCEPPELAEQWGSVYITISESGGKLGEHGRSGSLTCSLQVSGHHEF